MATKPKAAPSASAIEGIIHHMKQVEVILNELQQPVNQTPDTIERLSGNLRATVKNWIDDTNKLILLNANGEPNGFKSDSTGILKAQSDFSKPAIRAKYRHAHLVDKFAREILDEQTKDTGMDISPSEVIDQVTDDTKPAIDIPMSSGEHVHIDKASGDTTITDSKGQKKTIKGHFGGVAAFAKKIFGWLMDICIKFKNYITGLFRVPKEEDVLNAAINQR